MPEPRNCATMLRLEPTFQHMLDRLVNQSGLTAAGYLRRLVIEDLQKKGLLTVNMLTRVTTMSPSEINSLMQEERVS